MAKFTGHTITSDSALGSAKIQRSLRFNHDDDPYLSFTPSTTGNQKIWTFSAWIKRTEVTDNRHYIYSANDGDSGYFALYFDNDNIKTYFDPGNNYGTVNDREYRDVTAWIHIVHQVDATNTVQRIWINGVEETLSSSRNPGNNNYPLNEAGKSIIIGRHSWGSTSYSNWYLAEVNHVDGQLIAPTDFAFTDPVTGIWMPKRYEGTYGTNGFYLDFSDNSSTATLGIDKSPNGNDFTVNNFSVSAGTGNDSLEDTPTNNFCTLNAVNQDSNTTLTEGNLKATGSSSTAYANHTHGTIAKSSGRWYYEVEYTANAGGHNSNLPAIGWARTSLRPSDNPTVSVGLCYRPANADYIDLSGNDTSDDKPQTSTGNVIQVAIDLDAGKIWFGNGGTYFESGNPSTGANATLTFTGGAEELTPFVRSLSSTFNFNFGQRAFSYTPPTGFNKLSSSDSIPTSPSIVRPKKHFDTLIYTGNGSADRDITGLEFKPDFVWIKNRDDYDWHMLQDVIRGANKVLYANTNDGEDTDNSNGHVNHFIEGGFNVTAGASGNTNINGEDYVAWCWKAGGAAVSNSDGTVTSSISVNKEAGFSIVTYTGNATASQTVGHGLGAAPNMVITKRRNSSDNWQVYWNSQGSGQATSRNGFLNLSNAMNNPAHVDQWGGAVVTSTTFPLGASDVSNNGSGDTYVSYCWTGIPGYSKFGEYTGNGNTNGSFVYCGFRPAFLIAKKYSGTDAWMMWDSTRDPHNLMHHRNSTEYYPETTSENSGSSQCDFLANGFKWRGTSNDTNGDGDGYVFWAFAEQPSSTPFGIDANAR